MILAVNGVQQYLMSVTAGIAAVKASLELAKLLSDKLDRPDIDVADVRAKVHEMLIHMVNAQVALGDANAEISDLRGRLQDRQREAAIEASLEFGEDLYWRRTADHGFDGPYCPTCWDDDRKLIHLKFVAEGSFPMREGRRRRYDCVLHKTEYFVPVGIFGPPRTIR